MASIQFVSESHIRIINKEGIDCLYGFTEEDCCKQYGLNGQNSNVAIKVVKLVSFCKRDNWNPDVKLG